MKLSNQKGFAHLLVILLIVLGIGFGVYISSQRGNWFPKASTNLVTDPNAVFTIPNVAKPGYLNPIIDPTFKTKITRIGGDPGSKITALNGTGTWGTDARQHYNDDQAWNADQTLLHLENKGSGAQPSEVYLDGETYLPKYVKCSNYSKSDDRWHPSLSHKNERINVRSSQAILEWFDVTTCTQTRVWSLPFVANNDLSQNPSADGRFIALYSDTQMFVVDMDPPTPLPAYCKDGDPRKCIGPTYQLSNCTLSNCAVDHADITPSGKYVIVAYQGSNGDALRVLDVNPTTLALSPRNIIPNPTSSAFCSGNNDPAHGSLYDLGHDAVAFNPFDPIKDANGNVIGYEEVVIGQRRSWCPSTVGGVAMGRAVMVRLSDNKVTALTNPSNEAYSSHNSTLNVNRPGWAYVSYSNESSGKKYNDEIIAVKMDGSKQVERYLHTRTDQSDNGGACDYGYRCETHPVPSRDGLRVIFASSWSMYCGSLCGTQANPQAYVMDARDLSGGVIPTPAPSFVPAPTPPTLPTPIPTPAPTRTPTPTPTVVPTSTPTSPSSVTFSKRVTSGSDDAEQFVSGGSMRSLSSSDLELTNDGGTQVVGMRFRRVNVPKGATILNAYIEFTVKETQSGATSLTIQAENVDNSATFMTSNNNISNRAKTSTSIAWSPSADWNRDGLKKQTPDLSAVIQQVVNRSGWNSGNALSIIINGTGQRTAYSYNGSSSLAPKLVITYR